MWAFFLALLLLFELLADIFAKEWSLYGHPWRWLLALSGYIIGNIFWLYSMKHGAGLARGTVLFALGTELMAAALGLFYYREHLSSVQMAGVLLGTVAIVLIFWPDIVAFAK